MFFNSILFLSTLFLFLTVYFSINEKRSVRAKIVILAYSYFFYGMWDAAFLILIIASTIIDYLAARFIEKVPEKKKIFVTASLICNLGLLGFFKYFNFFVDTLTPLVHFFGINWAPPLLKLSLPVGISFYTFQTLSYTLDVYRGKIKAANSFLDVAVFIAFFPQLVAGPIVRASHFLPQLRKESILNNKDMADGITQILSGLFLKVVIADNVAGRVNYLFDHWQYNGMVENWTAAMLFGIQIYGDFCGYSMIAIGIAKMMGFSLPDNFNAPYAASGVSDFWHRWHISLSLWLRDYLYISLGGNRRGTGRTYINILITMLLGGLWHGASIMFVIWGMLHGIYLCVERRIKKQFQHIKVTKKSIRYVLSGLIILLTYFVVSITWIPFRAGTPDQGFAMMHGLFGGHFNLDSSHLTDIVFISFVFIISCVTRYWNIATLLQKNEGLRFVWVTVALISLYYFSGERTEFIYFQF